ncbi:hypothetical protein BDN70DRAFT_265167 [Pholiota conissans]|uniref:Secreted protein n=1 Tax=Pholiota conissans TaxID=109636 RepID=A0A9P5ZC63_9AGAR|nr:hypothetical protein BDN70DRAFT_265167 [Pholiota conissans]
MLIHSFVFCQLLWEYTLSCRSKTAAKFILCCVRGHRARNPAPVVVSLVRVPVTISHRHVKRNDKVLETWISSVVVHRHPLERPF